MNAIEEDLHRVEAQALVEARKVIADLPDPARYARDLEIMLFKHSEAIRLAYFVNGQGQEIGYKTRSCDSHLIPYLRTLGLIEVGGVYLTGFGNSVRRALLEEHGE